MFKASKRPKLSGQLKQSTIHALSVLDGVLKSVLVNLLDKLTLCRITTPGGENLPHLSKRVHDSNATNGNLHV